MIKAKSKSYSERSRTLHVRIAAICLAATLTGCAGYRLGSTLPKNLRSISVATFVNEAGEPLLETETTSAAIREFQKDGTLQVVGDSADLILKVTLSDYSLQPIRYDRDREKRTNEYRMIIRAKIECRVAKSGEILVSKNVAGDTTFSLVGSLSVAKRDALPATAADLAHDIVESIVEVW
ncbi:MAG: LptE family protein [Kiritimatiellia bacterium]|jgi:hypothetical protein|nr:LptE family protein [Kiritimatiellia bacterium]MDP6848110.1 LptE family protein [Kiritimatiellia bacterium]